MCADVARWRARHQPHIITGHAIVCVCVCVCQSQCGRSMQSSDGCILATWVPAHPTSFCWLLFGLGRSSLGHTCHPFSQLVLVVTMAPKRNGIHSQRIDDIRALRRQAQQELRTLRTDLKKDRADDRSARIHALGIFVVKTCCELPSTVPSFCSTI